MKCWVVTEVNREMCCVHCCNCMDTVNHVNCHEITMGTCSCLWLSKSISLVSILKRWTHVAAVVFFVETATHIDGAFTYIRELCQWPVPSSSTHTCTCIKQVETLHCDKTSLPYKSCITYPELNSLSPILNCVDFCVAGLAILRCK